MRAWRAYGGNKSSEEKIIFHGPLMGSNSTATPTHGYYLKHFPKWPSCWGELIHFFYFSPMCWANWWVLHCHRAWWHRTRIDYGGRLDVFPRVEGHVWAGWLISTSCKFCFTCQCRTNYTDIHSCRCCTESSDSAQEWRRWCGRLEFSSRTQL